ncbi:MAG: hypothetical protein JST82_08560 [Bacteroidetes bacterium]|nr:hypothetical protein [Bacteroidota bacterium]
MRSIGWLTLIGSFIAYAILLIYASIQDSKVFIVLVVLGQIWGVTNYSIVTIGVGKIKIMTFNPFKKDLSLPFSDIDKIVIKAPIKSRSYIKITTRGITYEYNIGFTLFGMERLYGNIKEQYSGELVYETGY